MTETGIRLWFNGAAIRDDGKFLCLTDMWRAAGADESKRPSEWLRHDATQEFVAYLETMGSAHSLVRTAEGRTGGTWAHWQLAMAYAKYLSPAFHAWCNDVVRKVMAGEPVGRAAPEVVTLSDKLTKLTQNVASLWEQISTGGYIPAVRFRALQQEWTRVADLEVALGRWKNRKAAVADIHRDMREHTQWGGADKPWRLLPQDREPSARSVLARRHREAIKRLPPRQLTLAKTARPPAESTKAPN